MQDSRLFICLGCPSSVPYWASDMGHKLKLEGPLPLQVHCLGQGCSTLSTTDILDYIILCGEGQYCALSDV